MDQMVMRGLRPADRVQQCLETFVEIDPTFTIKQALAFVFIARADETETRLTVGDVERMAGLTHGAAVRTVQLLGEVRHDKRTVGLRLVKSEVNEDYRVESYLSLTARGRMVWRAVLALFSL
jgi:DNA-binding MarR family transcriptional regulator